MKKAIQLFVSSPCHEQWENFDRVAQGGFCSRCSKVVVDFTKMSDPEIIQHFIQATSHICGRFRPDQLKVYEEKTIPAIQPGFTLLKASVLILFLMLTGKFASAQPLVTKAQTELVVDLKMERETVFIPIAYNTVRGVVKSKEDKEVMPGVNVVVKGTVNGTVTDADGQFELTDLKAGDVLVFSFIGVMTKEFEIRDIKNSMLEIEMVLSMDVLGEVSVTGLYVTEPHGFARLWSKVKELF